LRCFDPQNLPALKGENRRQDAGDFAMQTKSRRAGPELQRDENCWRIESVKAKEVRSLIFRRRKMAGKTFPYCL